MYKFVGIIVYFIAIGLGCSKSDDEGIQLPPVFVSSIPENGATGVALTSPIEVTFDEVVTLANQHGITINSQHVNPSVLHTKLTLHTSMELNKKYNVVIPAGAVINTKKVPLKEKVEFSFTSRGLANKNIKPTLSVPNPSSQAVNVYNFLKTNYGNKIISGTMANVSWNINEANWVHAKTSKYPALNGFDLIHLYASPANWINYEDISVIEQWWEKNGLVTLMWHWNVPKSQGSSEYAFYTNQTTFDITRAVQDGTWENGIIKADMAKAAVTLKKMQEKGIPVLWRPLHEAAGKWFWWGAKGPAPCKALWKMMFEFFKNEGLNNLIWVWTVETGDDDWYPGNEYVDIIGRDLYTKSDISWLVTQFNSIQAKYPDKIVALSECGSVAQISGQFTSGATWSFYMPWYDYNRTVTISGANFESNDHQHANALWWINAFANPAVITRDQMPSLK